MAFSGKNLAFNYTIHYTMEQVYEQLSRRALDLLESNSHYRIVILLSGAPGSGKSTVAKQVAQLINKKYSEVTGSHRSLNKKNNDSTMFFQGSLLVDCNKLNDIANYLTSAVTNKLQTFDANMPIDVEDENYQPRKVNYTKDEIVISGRSLDNAIRLTIPDDSQEVDTFAQVVPMDGFHLPRSSLEQFADSEAAFQRRGAPFTFDASAVVTLVRLLKSTCDVILTNACPEPIFCDAYSDVESYFSEDEDHLGSARSSVSQIFEPLDYSSSLSSLTSNFSENSTWKTISGKQTLIPDIYIPNFDHALKDPSPGSIKISSTTRVVIMEGLYLLLNLGAWADIHALTDGGHQDGFETWNIQIEEALARRRVSERHLKSGIVANLKDGRKRYDLNDCINGRFINNNSYEADIIIHASGG